MSRVPSRLPVLIMLVVLGCREPIELHFDQLEAKKVVIDGYLTDSLRRHEIRVSHTSQFNDFGAFQPAPISNANVSIVDDLGAVIFLSLKGPGVYETPLMSAQSGRSYKVEVVVEEATFASEFVTLPSGNADLSLSYEAEIREELSTRGFLRERKGVRIDATINNATQETFLLWELQHHFIGEAYLVNQYCFVKDFSVPEVNTFEIPALNAIPGNQFGTELEFIERDYKFKHDFAVVAKQLIVDRMSFNYWHRIEEQIENVGGLFDSAPAPIYGNIVNTNTGDQTLGNFGVYKESIERVFFNQRELPYQTIDYECPSNELPYCTDCLTHVGAETVALPSPQRYWWRCLIFFDNEDVLGTSTKPLDQCD